MLGPYKIERYAKLPQRSKTVTTGLGSIKTTWIRVYSASNRLLGLENGWPFRRFGGGTRGGRSAPVVFWSKTGGEFGQRRRSAGAAEGTELLQALFVQLSAAADAPLRPGVAFAPPPRVGFYVLESRAEPVTPAATSEPSELHKIWVMSEVDDRTGASAW